MRTHESSSEVQIPAIAHAAAAFLPKPMAAVPQKLVFTRSVCRRIGIRALEGASLLVLLFVAALWAARAHWQPSGRDYPVEQHRGETDVYRDKRRGLYSHAEGHRQNEHPARP